MACRLVLPGCPGRQLRPCALLRRAAPARPAPAPALIIPSRHPTQTSALMTAEPRMTLLWAAPEVLRCERVGVKVRGGLWRTGPWVSASASTRPAIHAQQMGAYLCCAWAPLPSPPSPVLGVRPAPAHLPSFCQADIWSYGVLIWEIVSGQDVTRYAPLAFTRMPAPAGVRRGRGSGVGRSGAGTAAACHALLGRLPAARQPLEPRSQSLACGLASPTAGCMPTLPPAGRGGERRTGGAAGHRHAALGAAAGAAHLCQLHPAGPLAAPQRSAAGGVAARRQGVRLLRRLMGGQHTALEAAW